MQWTQFPSLGREDPLEKETAPYSSTLAWKIPWTEDPGRLWSIGLQRVGQDWSNFTTCTFRNNFLISKNNMIISVDAEKIFDKIQHPLMIKTLQKLGIEGTYLNISSVQFSRSVVSDSLRPHEPQHTRPPCPSPIPGVHPNPIPLSRWCHPTISSVFPSPPALNPSHHQGLFQWVSSSHQVAKLLELQLQLRLSNECSGMIYFKIEWFDLLAVQGTLKSLLQHHSSKASILQCSAFFTVQLSHPYMTTGRTIALSRWNLVGKIMSLLFSRT